MSKPFARTILYPIGDHLFYNNLSLTYKSYLRSFLIIHEPTSHNEASLDTRWLEAMQDE